MIMPLFKEDLVPANLVPAAAVKREGQALSEMTGRKESVDCTTSYLLNPRSNFKKASKTIVLSSFIQKS